MKHTNVPKILLAVTFIFALLLIIGDKNIALGQASTPNTNTGTDYLSGFAWSSTIGWISMSGANYGVTVDPSGNLGGHAWSSNLGWISFNPGDTATCPAGNGPCAATINKQNGIVSGWIRACSGSVSKDCQGPERTDGWQGWIHLSGTNHASPNVNGTAGVTYVSSGSKLTGFAWGSDVVGWVNFNGVSVVDNQPNTIPVEYGTPINLNNTYVPVATVPPTIPKFRMTSNMVNKGESCTMTWEVDNATTCTIGGAGFGSDYLVSLPTGSAQTAPITSSQIYSLTCSNAAGTVSKTAACRLNPNITEQ